MYIQLGFTLTLQLFFVLFTGSIVYSKCSPTEFTPIQISHGTKCCLLVLVFAEAITLWLACLPIIYQPGEQNQAKYQAQMLHTHRVPANIAMY